MGSSNDRDMPRDLDAAEPLVALPKIDMEALAKIIDRPQERQATGATGAASNSTTRVLPVTQEWTWALPLMQQTVLLTAIRGPDNIAKYDVSKMLIRFLRRCILLSAMDHCVWNDPHSAGGGSFTGPSFEWEYNIRTGAREDTTWQEKLTFMFSDYLRNVDCIPHHFHMHFMHAVQILGYKHPDEEIRTFWNGLYYRFCNDMHLLPEAVETMDERLSDNRDNWLAHSDPATVA